MNTSPTIHDLPAMPVAQVAALDTEVLADLLEQADAHFRQARTIKESLDDAVSRRYGDRAALVRNQNNKPTGIVRFGDGSFTIIADLPKKPEWNQQQLAAIVGQIREAGDNPLDYVEVSYRVPESRFNAWPTTIRRAFEPARTLKVGKPTFKIERPASRGGA